MYVSNVCIYVCMHARMYVSQCSTIGVTKVMVCAILSVGWYI